MDSLPTKGTQSYLWSLRLRILWTIIAYILGKAFYNIYLHPLSKFPGPKLYAASQIPREAAVVSGKLHYKLKSLHEQYGDVVRTAPNELTFTSAQAMKDVLTRQGGNSFSGFPKDPINYNIPPAGTHNILTVRDDGDHTRYRRLLNHAFSEKALQEQSPLIKKYVDLLISRLHEHAAEGPQDMVNWFNFVAFDIIGDLALGESFSCLETSELHPWVSFLYSNFKAGALLTVARKFPPFQSILLKLVPKRLVEERIRHSRQTREKVLKRMGMGQERGDFMSNVLRHNDKETGMSEAEITATFAILVLAGSETTATLLAAVTYYLLKNPASLRKLKTEIRTTFKSEDEITQVSANQLQYQLAVLDEAMRLHPPAPFGFPRVVPEGGRTVDGHWVPGGTAILIPTYVMHHVSNNWNDGESFVPERWTSESPYTDDNKAAFAPFSMGGRNCIGRNLGYAEMRLILAKLLWNFDLELDERSLTWAQGMKMYLLWEKSPLYVKLKPVLR